MTRVTIGFVGMTHLGLISAVGAAEKGFKVSCFDRDEKRVQLLQEGTLNIVEPMLPELLHRNRARLTFTHHASSLHECDLIYIAPDVPTDENGRSDLTEIEKMISLVIPHLKPEALLVILSQVPPGFTRKINWEKKKLFYQVETLIFGLAIERTLHPERFIIGASYPDQPLPSPLLHFLRTFDCPLLPMRYESAELSKIAINLFLVSSVSTTNTIAELCEKIGADWAEIVPALQMDRRIGKYAYLAPGLGIAGGNLERDMATFLACAEEHGTESGLVRAWKANARHRCDWVLKKVHELVLSQHRAPIFALLGLAYKKNTASTKNSPALTLMAHLKDFKIRAYDPAVSTLPDCYPDVTCLTTAREAYLGADCLMIMTPWEEFAHLPIEKVAQELKNKTILDPYGVLDSKQCLSLGLNYHKLGV